MTASSCLTFRTMLVAARHAALAGTAGGIAMIPVGLALRLGFGATVNVYGELLVQRILGRLVPWALVVEHFLISWALAVPLLWFLARRPASPPTVIGLAYGAAIWAAINSLALPLAFGRATPWEIGWPAIWPSLLVHLVYGVATSHAAARAVRAEGR